MPQYAFLCKDCKKRFSKFVAIAAYKQKKIVYPQCSSGNVKQQLSPFYAVISR